MRIATVSATVVRRTTCPLGESQVAAATARRSIVVGM
jgi:hypothetical protein